MAEEVARFADEVLEGLADGLLVFLAEEVLAQEGLGVEVLELDCGAELAAQVTCRVAGHFADLPLKIPAEVILAVPLQRRRLCRRRRWRGRHRNFGRCAVGNARLVQCFLDGLLHLVGNLLVLAAVAVAATAVTFR